MNAAPPTMTSPRKTLSRAPNSVNLHSWAIQFLKKLAPFCSVILSTWTLPTRRFEITNITPRRVKNDASVTMKLGKPGLVDHEPVEPADGGGSEERGADGPADVDAVAHEEARHEPDLDGGRAGHDARRQVELATDHQQRHRRGHDACRSRDVEPVERGVGLAEGVAVAPEERPDDDGADQGADLRRDQPPAHRAPV